MTDKTLEELAEAATPDYPSQIATAACNDDGVRAICRGVDDLLLLHGAIQEAALPVLDQHAAEIAAKDASYDWLMGRYQALGTEVREKLEAAERSLAEANARIKELEEERDAANDRTVKMIETVQRMRRAGEDLVVRLRAALAGTDTPEKAGV